MSRIVGACPVICLASTLPAIAWQIFGLYRKVSETDALTEWFWKKNVADTVGVSPHES